MWARTIPLVIQRASNISSTSLRRTEGRFTSSAMSNCIRATARKITHAGAIGGHALRQSMFVTTTQALSPTLHNLLRKDVSELCSHEFKLRGRHQLTGSTFASVITQTSTSSGTYFTAMATLVAVEARPLGALCVISLWLVLIVVNGICWPLATIATCIHDSFTGTGTRANTSAASNGAVILLHIGQSRSATNSTATATTPTASNAETPPATVCERRLSTTPVGL